MRLLGPDSNRFSGFITDCVSECHVYWSGCAGARARAKTQFSAWRSPCTRERGREGSLPEGGVISVIWQTCSLPYRKVGLQCVENLTNSALWEKYFTFSLGGSQTKA